MSNVSVRSKHFVVQAVMMAATLFAIALMSATSAHAQADNFLNGDGHDGTVTFPAGTHVPNAVAPVSGAVPAGATSISIGTTVAGSGSNAVGFAANRLVMVYQSNGAATPPTSGNQTAYALSNSTAGHWEFGRLLSATATTLTFTNPLINTYAAGATQVIAVPEYNGVTIATGATINAPAWNGTTGGVVAILAQGTISVAGTGTVTASGLGFRGGLSYLNNAGQVHNCSATAYDSPGTDGFGMKGEGFYAAAYATSTPGTNGQHGRGNQLNAGGGGNCFNGGGGGGGNVGQGGLGGNSLNQAPGSDAAVGGLGGAAVTYNAYHQIPRGGGGGQGDRDDANSGAGAKGGGVVYVRGGTLTGTGTFSANGAVGTAGNNSGTPYDGAGGGGAGGSVVLRFVNGAACTSATATGGTGGANGTSGGFSWTPGGGGGGGAVYVQGSTVACTRTVTGGARGTGGSNNGATAGGNGAATANAVALAKPVITLTTPVNGTAYATTTPAINGTATGSSTVYVYIDNTFVATTTAAVGGAWSYSTAALSQGSHSIMVFSDVSGSQSDAISRAFTVDTGVPAAPSINTPSTNITTNDTTPAIAGLAEIGSTVKVYEGATLIGTAVADGSGIWALSPDPTLSAGAHTLFATATDAANNVSPNSATRTITIDTAAPSVSISAPVNAATVGPNGNVTFTATDAVGPVTTTCQIDSGSIVSCTSPYAFSGLTTGAHSATVVATDAAGNTATAVRNFSVDATSPNTTITANPAAVTNATGASFSFTSTESPSTFECQIDGGAIAACTSPKAYAGLAQGSHTFSVRAIDQYGNVDQSPASFTWTVDTSAPVAPTISTPGSDIVTNDTTPAIGGLSEVGSTVKVYEGATLIGTAVANGSGVWALSPDPTLTQGVHVLKANATDPAGNVSPDSSNRTITVDTTAPTVSLSAPANGSTVATTTPAITFAVVDGNQSPASSCVIDGAPAVTCSSGYIPPALGQGSHTVVVSHTDLAGNVGSSATNTFTVDTVAPAAPNITSGPSAPVASTTATFAFTGEAGGSYECYVDSPVSWAACTSPKTYNSLAQGSHTFHVRQTDAVGNVGGESTRSWSVDTVGPPAPSVSGPTGTVGQTSATITFNDTESPVTYMCSLDGAAAALCTSPKNLTGLSDGPHSYAVYAVDPLGNAGSPTTINWTVDSSLFSAGITAGPLGTVATSNNSLSFTATITSGTTFMCKVDLGAFAACTSPYSTGVLADGSHTFSVYAVNGAQTSATVTRTWSIDTAAPVLTISAPTNGQTVAPNGNVTFSATDATGPVTYTCKIDSGSATSCGSPYVFTGLTSGAHSATVVATDAVGNNSTVIRNFVVDATPPNTTITANPASVTNSTSASFSFTSTESPSTFECQLDGGAIAACTVPKTYSGLSQASHTFSVRAIDQYGNADQTPASYVWTVDTTAPVAPSINTPAADIVTADTTPSVGGLAEPNATVKVYEGATLVGTATADGSGNWALAPDPTLAEGAHALVARATDAAGNTSANSSTRTITIDTISPVVTITSPATGSVTGDNTPNIVFTATDANLTLVQCSVDGGAAVTCSSPWTTPILSDGLHTVSVLGADATGSHQTVASVTFTVDTTAPSAPLISTPASDTSTTALRPSIGGSAEPNAQIKVYDGVAQIGTATATAGGTWTFTPTSDLSEAAHPLHVTATDTSGNTSVNSNIRTITVDRTNPSAPVINSPASDGSSNNVRQAVGGTAEPSSTVTVYDGATQIGTTTATAGGSWTFTPSSDLSESAHPFHATATDAAGNTGTSSNVRTITIDLTDPAAPVITTPAQDLTSGVNTQAIGGTAEPNSTVTVYDGAAQIGTATTDGSGNWSLSPDPTFAEGVHPIAAWATDGAGNTSPASGNRVITIDNTAPIKPVISSPATGDNLGDATPVVSGTAEPGSTVDVFDGATLICSGAADVNGDWNCTPSTPLSEGDHTLTARATDAYSNESNPSDDVVVTIDLTSPAAAISGPVDGSTIATHTPAVAFTATDDNLDTVECKADGDSYAACTSAWTTASLADGVHTVTVRATDFAGNTATATTTFTVDTTAPASTIGTKPPALDNDTTPSFGFTSDDVGATFECRIDADAFAPCSSPFTAGSPLSDGPHTFEVRATDAQGNTESPAAGHTWTVDATPPAKPVVTTPTAGGTTNDATPTISGTAEAGSSVQVFVDGNPIGTVTADGSGNWTINASHLADGPHTATARATDGAGNTGAVSDDDAFTVDTTPPGGTVTEVPGSGGGGSNPTFDISTPDGTATIACSLDGAAAAPCSAPFTPTGTLSPGTHTLVVTFTDPSGNVTTRTLTFVIAGPTVTPPPVVSPPPADSDPLPSACFAKGIAITNLAVVGGKVKISGFARLRYAGQTVSLTYKPTGAKVVGTTVVAADGSFTASAPAPAKKLRLSNKSLYSASVAGEKTPWTKLARRVASSTASYSGGKVVVSGLLSKPLMPKAPVTISARTGCSGPWVKVAVGKVKPSGAFSTATPYKVSTGVVFVRVAAIVSKGGSKPKPLRTYSFVMPVVLR
jgi:hypothetical protein